MPRSLFTALVLGALYLPLVFAAAPAFVPTQFAEPYIRKRDALPTFDGRLRPEEKEIAMNPVQWRKRWRNDTSYGLTTTWPQTVERLLVDHMGALRRENPSLWSPAELDTGDEWSADMRGSRTVLPGGIEIYAVEHPWIPTGHRGLSFVVRDGATGGVSRRVETLVQKWSSVGDEDGPTAWWADVLGDGSPEFGVERTYHNGTVEHGQFVRWFRVTEELGLELVHVSPLLDEVRGVSRGEEGVIRTRLLRGADGELIHDQWFENPAYGVAPRAMARPPVGKKAGRRYE